MALTSEGAAITSRPLCTYCVNQIQQRLDQLPDYMLALRSHVRNSIVAQSGGAKVASSKEAPTPINLHALDLINQIAAILVDWEGVKVVDLITQQDGVPAALHISKVWKRAEDQVGFTAVWERRFGACPRCQLSTLGSFSGSANIQCSNCGGAMTRQEYARITLVRADSSSK